MIRYAFDADKDALMRLYHESFPGEEDFCRFYFDTLWDPRQTLVLCAQDQIVSAIHTLKATLKNGAEIYKATYLYMVGTLKSERGKGLMNELLCASFGLHRQNGFDFSSLIVESESLFNYYSRFGYQKSFFLTKREASQRLPEGYITRPLQKADIGAVTAIYEGALNGRLYHQRTLDDFVRTMALYEGHVLLAPKGDIDSYCFLRTDEGNTAALEALEALGPHGDALACALNGGKPLIVHRPAEEGAAYAIGCLKPLSERGARDLSALTKTLPYMNLLFN